MSKQWFDVDVKGLGALMERRGKSFAVMELIQNALDTGATEVSVELNSIPGSPGIAGLVVTDDDPNGFTDLAHAFTLFAPSAKKGDATKRGRFNLGEKLVLALCKEATISSTTGQVLFGVQGRRQTSKKRHHGTEFRGLIRMTISERVDAIDALHRLIVPYGIDVSVNGEMLSHRAPIAMATVTLPTEIADEDGVLRRRQRKTTVELHAVAPDETASIYELGIPVVETGDQYHYNVMQKVPLALERDNVLPSYLLALRTAAINETHHLLDTQSANAAWARDALESPDVSKASVNAILDKRFGEKRVIFDMSDLEANKVAVMKGYTVIPPRSFGKAAWANIKANDGALPAGQVTPPDRPFSDSGPTLSTIPEDDWTPGQRFYAGYARAAGMALLGALVSVVYTKDPGFKHAAAFGPQGILYINTRKFRLADVEPGLAFDAMLIHEFAHFTVSDHLSENFYTTCCTLGAKLARWEKRTTWVRDTTLAEAAS